MGPCKNNNYNMDERALMQPDLTEEIAKAYGLQETLKKERQQVRLHEEEYQKLMDLIISSKVQRSGEYEVTEAIVQKKRQIISDKFRKKWPKLFNHLATVTMRAAREEGIGEHDLEAVCEIKTVTKHVIMIRNGP